MHRLVACALLACACSAPGSSNPDGGPVPPAGWLFTAGNKLNVSTGTSNEPWMGRGVNIDDVYLCGYNYTLWMTNPESTLETLLTGLLSDWKPNFLRLSLGMATYPTQSSWTANEAQYKTPMTTFINSIGTHRGVYVLVTLRSHASMIGQDTVDGDPEATGLPSDASNTPDAANFPDGTDSTYKALVQSFASSNHVMFGVTNEPGGNKRTNDEIRAAMVHAVGVIRAEEDRLSAPHHIISVQGNIWSSDIGFYATNPLPYDNVVYEVHGYPPDTGSYTYSNIPVIIGEYGTLGSTSAPLFFADVEAKQIPNLAWDFEPYSDCTPDLVDVTQDATMLNPTGWGTLVKGYLTSTH
jgi:hypothetical protein